jgi:uncharacterized protein (DUF983 family)
MTLVHTVATITSDYNVAMNVDTIAVFVIPLVALLMTSAMMWHKEHLWNVSVLQRVCL